MDARSIWESFYVIVGSSAAALTGLQFVVIALIAEGATRTTSREISAFGTPTVIHFCATLLVAAIISAPWGALSSVSLAVAACGLAGVVYCTAVIRRARQSKGYQPEMSDWVWHTVLPVVAYTSLVLAAVALQHSPEPALFVVGGASLLLLFIGIHNAWDTVTYIAVRRFEAEKQPEKRSRAASAS